MNKIIVFLLCAVFASPIMSQRMEWSIENDSAVKYYEEGWKKVMDEGNYSASENAYRKMYESDPDFLVGAALLGRISTNLDEQISLLEQIEESQDLISTDEKKILDAYTELHRLMIYRQTMPEKTKTQVEKALGLSLKNTGLLSRKYPDEPYLLAEYIETIHYLFGADQALDSLRKLDPEEDVIFLTGYKALLLAETGKEAEALQQSDKMFMIYPSGSIPKPYAVKAQVYDILNQPDMVKDFMERALLLDPKNIDMLRIKSKYQLE